MFIYSTVYLQYFTICMYSNISSTVYPLHQLFENLMAPLATGEILMFRW